MSNIPAGKVPQKGEGSTSRHSNEPNVPPRRSRRLHRIWPDRNGNISYLLTICVEGRIRSLNNRRYFDLLTAFLLDSAAMYDWYPRRFVVMPDHLHIIAAQGQNALSLGLWIKALKAVSSGLIPAGQLAPGSSNTTLPRFVRVKRTWRWQIGFHDHKFRTPESEARKWEYVCLNPVRYNLVSAPEHWPYGGEIFYDDRDGPRLEQGTPPLLKTGLLIPQDPSA